ncbi:hypothetical protein F2P81_021465 [Scophthalmus maximus]|uniref:Uncharacterized protein n=1 Tax=Scophthalmus maximus TaxID=52904 RepID=A0A6A4S3I5_SCOMX|nr:hypothetical protein F2P81_021465 [Scophthalmus maximus]
MSGQLTKPSPNHGHQHVEYRGWWDLNAPFMEEKQRESVRVDLSAIAAFDSRVSAPRKCRYSICGVNTHTVPLVPFQEPHAGSGLSQAAAAAAASPPTLRPATNAPRRHDLFVSFGPNPTRPDRHFPAAACRRSGPRTPAPSLPIETPLRHSRASGAPLLFRPTPVLNVTTREQQKTNLMHTVGSAAHTQPPDSTPGPFTSVHRGERPVRRLVAFFAFVLVACVEFQCDHISGVVVAPPFVSSTAAPLIKADGTVSQLHVAL